jgi:hypothetical protein
MTKKSGVAKGWRTAKFAWGVAICLTGGFLMWDGSILGENTAGIATIVGIIGIGLIGASGAVASGIVASEKTAEGIEP